MNRELQNLMNNDQQVAREMASLKITDPERYAEVEKAYNTLPICDPKADVPHRRYPRQLKGARPPQRN